jgi:hypothetical protein
MTDQRNGAPIEDGAPKGPTGSSGHPTTPTKSNDSATGRQRRRGATVGRCAYAWREGFTRGALDALRVAQREIDDPNLWLLLSRLADRYGDPDDYELAGGGS